MTRIQKSEANGYYNKSKANIFALSYERAKKKKFALSK